MADTLTLHGKLVFVASIFHIIRPYLPSIISFSKSFRNPRAHLHPSRAVTRDLGWINQLLRILPISMPLSLPDPIDLDWWGDASTSFGIGVVINSHWAVWQWAPGFTPAAGSTFDIGWAEAVAVELGVRLLVHLGLHLNVTHRRFLVRSDNQGVVEMIKKGRCRSQQSNEILKSIHHLLADFRFSIASVYVPSRLNISDALSRGNIPAFLQGFPKAASKVSLPLPPHLSSKLLSL